MTYLEFRTFVAAALQRSEASLTVNGVNLLAKAVNMARKNVERRYDFELAKVVAKLTVPFGQLQSLDDAVDPADETEKVSIKTILRVQIASTGVPIGYLSRDAHQRRLERQFARAHIEAIASGLTATVSNLNLIRFGNSVYLSPPNAQDWSESGASLAVFMDVVAWMADYVDDDDTDFLLEHCADYLMLETYRYLQLFIKEDSRLNVSDEKMSSAWHALMTWNNNLVVGDSDDANLE